MEGVVQQQQEMLKALASKLEEANNTVVISNQRLESLAATSATQIENLKQTAAQQQSQYAETLTNVSKGLSAPRERGDFDLTKTLKQPVQLNDKSTVKEGSNYSEFRFQAENYLTAIHLEFGDDLKAAAESAVPLGMTENPESWRTRSVNLYAMLSQWTAANREVRIMANTLRREKNGYELWRLLREKFEPQVLSKGLVWRRTILNPAFPDKESQFQGALMDWEAEVLKYEEEEKKKIDDEDKMGVLLEVAPSGIQSHIRQNMRQLDTYAKMKSQVESYLTSKKVWTVDGRVGNQFGCKDPKKEDNRMQIDAFGSKGGKGSKGKGKGGKGGKEDKQPPWKPKPPPKTSDANADDPKMCSNCWLRHLPAPCWYPPGQGKSRSKGQGTKGADPKGKGKGKGDKGKKGKDYVNALANDGSYTQAEWGAWQEQQQQQQQQQQSLLTMENLRQQLQQFNDATQPSTTAPSVAPSIAPSSSTNVSMFRTPSVIGSINSRPRYDSMTGKKLACIKSAPSSQPMSLSKPANAPLAPEWLTRELEGCVSPAVSAIRFDNL